jgi:hypothetical protein
MRHLYSSYTIRVLIYHGRVEIYKGRNLNHTKYLNDIFAYSHDLETKTLIVKYYRVLDSQHGESYFRCKVENVDVVTDCRTLVR